jgi:alanyl-tRNA synthetase
LDAALRRVLGTHVRQAGSCVDGRRLRFDFNAFAAPTTDELAAVERLVEGQILACVPSDIFEVGADHIPEGCIANFGEKYGDVVRVVKFGDFSMELCGGCHVENTGEIACFKIVASTAIAAGIRRIEAVTGQGAFDLFRLNCEIVGRQCAKFCCQPSEIAARTDALFSRCKELEKFAQATRRASLNSMAENIARSAIAIGNGLVRVETTVDGANGDELRHLVSTVLGRIGEGVVVLTSRDGNGHSIVVGCSKMAVEGGHNAGNIVREIAAGHGGSGGGRPELAMGGYVSRT